MACKDAVSRMLPVSLAELCIDTTLRCGQSFRWRKVDDEWHCSLHGRVVSLRQDETHLHYRATWPAGRQVSIKSSVKVKREEEDESIKSEDAAAVKVDEEEDDTEALLLNYFNLHHSLSGMYTHWSDRDANFRSKAPKFTGVRILNQDAWETLVAFICSSNNNIARISQMCHKLCDHYGGEPIATVAGHVYRDFPSPEALAGDGVEAHLRELGFGYRARYIAETARVVARQRPAGWLLSLRNPASRSPTSTPPQQQQPDYRTAFAALQELSGVGPKVSDCVCLMGLGWGEAVPLDTHMWTIATRDYGFGGKKAAAAKGSAMSKGMYDAVGEHFRKLWGPQAGWAQSVLFTANLREFSHRLKATAESGVKREDGVGGDDSKPGVVADAVVAPPKQSKKRKTAVSTTRVKVEEDGGSIVATKVEIQETEVTPIRRSKRIRAGG
ncbi:N-glycosylase/DNA lyase [Pyricularia oryzae 70-15]|uniref:DNA-(apurinic or apyrimidinic site) lyase n=1 Tax=Pyricularia oryzae (strain 70-15 / ATCC MYA-4617 / FGSC 8958) TaxID=242507 RepID=G4NCQ8_PYRO7|nr:N-glycosylase/DNA lyase [Pyricularia oryzae 70-15]EHA49152.1 N-glycosylase/DNA lyase [Pyricularia oryzae 70-15]